MKNICVLVSGGGTNLQQLINAQKENRLGGGEITCVISSKPDVYALQRAADNGIKGVVLERKKFEDIASYSLAMKNLLVEEQADLVVYAGFLTILDETVCNAFPNRMMNVHPALIPSFCGKGYYGLKVHEAALEKGVKLTGATVHFVTEECDGGPIILQKAVEVRNGDTPEIFRFMQETGNIPERYMYNTFNMGIGMTCIVSRDNFVEAVKILEENGIKAYCIGEIIKGGEGIEIT